MYTPNLFLTIQYITLDMVNVRSGRYVYIARGCFFKQALLGMICSNKTVSYVCM